MSYGYCADCDRKDVSDEWKRNGTICPICWDVRQRFVKAAEAGKLTQEQLIYTQRGRHARRKKMLTILNSIEE